MLFRRWVLMVVWVYQRWVSPLLLPRCRYYPTCSCYVRTAFLSHSFGKACVLSFRRLVRCHPLGGFGVDFVPVPLYRYVYVPARLTWQPPFLQKISYKEALNRLTKL